MSAANFRTMENFDLYVKTYYEDAKRCTKCGMILDNDAEDCEYCGCGELEDYRYFDDAIFWDEVQDIKDALDDLNRDLLFHKITLEDGYYEGQQFYVETVEDLDRYDYSNDDCNYCFGCCRSVAYRKFAAEKRKINRKLAELAREWGYTKMVCVARFSNGEAWFQPADLPRARLKSVSCGY